MNNKIILTQICKNESHVAERMLNTVKGFVDILCIVDTGSTDNTIEVIENWGKTNNIETHVYQRPFDNFENSRNYSIKMAEEIAMSKKGKNNKYYGFWLDFDEELVIESNFNKAKLDKDLYMINTYINSMKYTRNELFLLNKGFRFYGPVHEFIIPSKEMSDKLTSEILSGVFVKVNMDGGSWISGDIHLKYKNHATVLEDYINTTDRDPRWVFYTAQSYHDSANIPNNRDERDERLRRAIKYYRERVNTQPGYFEERYYAQYRIGTISKQLELPWSEVEQELIKAYEIDPLRGESIKIIIDYYHQMGRWSAAYLWTTTAMATFHNKSPYPKFNGDPNGRLLFLDESLYLWKFLESHATSCFYTKRIDECRRCFDELINILKAMPNRFADSDKTRIMTNYQNIIGQIQNIQNNK